MEFLPFPRISPVIPAQAGTQTPVNRSNSNPYESLPDPTTACSPGSTSGPPP